MMKNEADTIYEFDRFRFDAKRKIFAENDRVVPLSYNALEILAALLENAGQVVEKDSLMQRVWADTFVEDHNLAQNISTLRKILGQTSEGRQFIETVPRRGYRFAVPVRLVENGETNGFSTERKTETVPPEKPPERQADKEFTEARGAETAAEAARLSASKPESKASGTLFGSKKTAAVAVALGGVLASAIFAWWFFSPDAELSAAARANRISLAPLTTSGNIGAPALSPDGSYLAYATIDQAERGSLWIMQLSTLATRALLTDAQMIFHAAAFSPDGQQIFFTALDTAKKSPRALYRINFLGSPPTKLMDDVQSGVSFSPDGRQIVFRRESAATKESNLVIADRDGGSQQIIAAIKYPERFNDPVWSPDGKTIACSAGHSEGGENNYLLAINVADRRVSRIAKNWKRLKDVVWTENSDALFAIAANDATEPPQIWKIGFPDGAAQQITKDSDIYSRLGYSPRAKIIVTLQTRLESGVWRLPREAPEKAQKISFGAGGYRGTISWTADDKLLYDSMVGGAPSISLMEADGRNPQNLLGEMIGKGNFSGSAMSRDGRYVVFAADYGGKRNIWRMNRDGTDPLRLTGGEGENFPDITPDGRFVYFTGLENAGGSRKRQRVYRVSINGGAAETMTAAPSKLSPISPDGQYFATFTTDENGDSGGYRLAIYPVAGGQPAKIFPDTLPSMNLLKWSRDGKELFYAENSLTSSTIWAQSVESGQRRVWTRLDGDRLFGMDWSKDDKTLAVVRGFWSHNVVLVRGVE